MKLELTDQQQQAVDTEQTPRVLDPRSGTAYVLLRADVFERMQELLGDGVLPGNAYPAIDRALAENWNDPRMNDYDQYEKLRRLAKTHPPPASWFEEEGKPF